MIAAIYARKSTEQDVADDAKSVTRQVDNARAFATSQGWTVDDRYIFIDDGISGADVRRLRERQRLLALVGPSCPFDVVVMQAQDRFSRRGGAEALIELQTMAGSVEVWFYAERKRFEFGTFASNTMGFLQGEFAAEFRRAIARKTHEAMVRRAQLGHVTGGRIFGYDNVRLNGHVERRVNDAEAAVVRDIFRRYAEGEGFKQIAFALNGQKAPSPRAQRGRAGWDPGTVRAVLKRSIYRGVITYNTTKKRLDDGSRRGRQRRKPESEWVRLDAPALRLIEPDVATRVDESLERRSAQFLRTTGGKLLGRPVEGKRLLSGFLVCECGSRFEASKGWGGSHVYVCSARRRKGPDVCPSPITFPVVEIEQVFLDAIEGSVLHPDFIDRVVDAVFAENPNDARQALLDERRRVATEVTNLTTAIAAGGNIPVLVDLLTKRDRELKALDAKLAKPTVIPDREALRAALRLRGTEWRDVLRGKHIPQARLVLQHLMNLPIRILNQPVPSYIRKGDTRGVWRAETRPGGLLVGLVQSMASHSMPSWNQILTSLRALDLLRKTTETAA